MLNWVLSVLALKGVISTEEAEKLGAELVLKTHPSRFSDAHKIVEKLLKDFEKNK